MAKWIKQKEDENNCGQIAISVITGRPLKTVIKIIGHNSYTTTRELAKCLNKLRYKCPNRLRRLKNKPKLAIGKLSLRWEKRDWHWVVIINNKIYDGIWGNSKGEADYNSIGKITSYLPILKKKDK